MKDLLSYFLRFAMVYGLKDKDKFREQLTEWLEPYALDEISKDKVIEIAYEFMAGWVDEQKQKSVIAGGVRRGNRDVESRMEEVADKLERILRKIPEKN